MRKNNIWLMLVMISAMALAVLVFGTPAVAETVNCTTCGAVVMTKFCPECGTPNMTGTWICEKCGNTDAKDAFCSKCGNARPVPKTSLSKNSFEGEGYDTAEEAMKAYIEFWKNDDHNSMISVYAIEHMTDHFSAEENIRQNRYYDIYMLRSGQLMNNVAEIRDLSIYMRLGVVADTIQRQYMVLHKPEITNALLERSSYAYSAKDGDNGIDNFLNVIGNYKNMSYGTIELVCLMDPDMLTGGMYSQIYSRTVSRNDSRTYFELTLARYGADDIKECVALLNVNGRECYLGLRFACWDGRWYIADPNSQTMLMLNMPVQFYGIAYADMLEIPSAD